MRSYAVKTTLMTVEHTFTSSKILKPKTNVASGEPELVINVSTSEAPNTQIQRK